METVASAQAAGRSSHLRPGTVFPLRTMGQDEVFSAAISVIRRNPKATLGLPLTAGLINFAASIVLLVVFPSQSMVRMLTDPYAFDDAELALAALNEAGLWVMLALSSLLGSLLLALSVGLLAIPTLRSAYGLRTTLTQTVLLRIRTLGWLVLHLFLLGLVLGIAGVVVLLIGGLAIGLTLGIGAVVVLPGLFLLLCWATAAVMFGPLAVVVERRNALAAIARSFRLNKGLWWRHIGAIALLYLIGGIALMVAAMPAAILTGIGSEAAWQSPEGQDAWAALAITGVGQLYDALLAALMAALAGTVAAVLYLNARFRREALDVVLLAAAADDTAEDEQLIPASPEHLSQYFASVHQPAGGAGRA